MEYIFFLATGFLLLRVIVAAFNYFDKPCLPEASGQEDTFISVLIPARNEAERIQHLLKSLAKETHKNFEILIYDDNSSDNTSGVVSAYASQFDRFKLIKGKPVPPGWLGKTYACHNLAEQSTGDILIYLDADTEVVPGFLSSCAAYVKTKDLSLCSVFNKQKMISKGEHLVVPLMHYILLSLLPLRLVYASKNPSFSAASGQCMIFRAEDYRVREWHRQVRDIITEDIAIMKLAKKQGYKGAALLSGGEVLCRMYKGYFDGIRGFTKNFLAGFGFNILAMLIYLFLVVLCWPILVFTVSPEWMLPVVVLMIMERVLISLTAGQNVLTNILLHPFQMLTMLIIAAMSVMKKINNTYIWKGRSIKV